MRIDFVQFGNSRVAYSKAPRFPLAVFLSNREDGFFRACVLVDRYLGSVTQYAAKRISDLAGSIPAARSWDRCNLVPSKKPEPRSRDTGYAGSSPAGPVSKPVSPPRSEALGLTNAACDIRVNPGRARWQASRVAVRPRPDRRPGACSVSFSP